MTIEGRVPFTEFAGIGEIIKHNGEGITLVPGKGNVYITISEGVTAEVFSRHEVRNYRIYDFRMRIGEQIPHHAGALIITPDKKRIRVPTNDFPEGHPFMVEGLGEWQWNGGSGKTLRKKVKKERVSL